MKMKRNDRDTYVLYHGVRIPFARTHMYMLLHTGSEGLTGYVHYLARELHPDAQAVLAQPKEIRLV